MHRRYGPKIISFPTDIADEVKRLANLQLSDSTDQQSIEQSINAKVNAALPHMLAKPWDMFAISFREIHALSHTVSDPVGDELGERYEIALLQQAFTSIDYAIGVLREAAGPDCNVVIYSTTGMGENRSIGHHAYDIMQYFNRRLSQRFPLHARFGHTQDEFVRKVRFNENALALRISRRTGIPHRLLVDHVANGLARLRVGNTERKLFDHIIDMA